MNKSFALFVGGIWLFFVTINMDTATADEKNSVKLEKHLTRLICELVGEGVETIYETGGEVVRNKNGICPNNTPHIGSLVKKKGAGKFDKALSFPNFDVDIEINQIEEWRAMFSSYDFSKMSDVSFKEYKSKVGLYGVVEKNVVEVSITCQKTCWTLATGVFFKDGEALAPVPSAMLVKSFYASFTSHPNKKDLRMVGINKIEHSSNRITFTVPNIPSKVNSLKSLVKRLISQNLHARPSLSDYTVSKADNYKDFKAKFITVCNKMTGARFSYTISSKNPKDGFEPQSGIVYLSSEPINLKFGLPNLLFLVQDTHKGNKDPAESPRAWTIKANKSGELGATVAMFVHSLSAFITPDGRGISTTPYIRMQISPQMSLEGRDKVDTCPLDEEAILYNFKSFNLHQE